ncbi:hypothetical protein GWO43_02105, partial [candidate division KSB1 bacterium]|nr:hypothetical protein [candidate division KSB1 bacterium]NIS22865.1 hypothetical protein [candidate division KSB1 bacterium]NIT69703.1 hypothetical protein [candidate division KSB1 bacterium]NIU23371.1 hypothetical protein [candidate division KSB1 bacterium]NIU92289.1 hypothetical protein [candidate division KSB1 bacterium]
MDPLRHYVIHGARENRKPAYWFDVEEYKYNHPEIEQSGINPFLHYCMNGDQDGNRLYPGERPAPPESWMQKLTSPWRW